MNSIFLDEGLIPILYHYTLFAIKLLVNIKDAIRVINYHYIIIIIIIHVYVDSCYILFFYVKFDSVTRAHATIVFRTVA